VYGLRNFVFLILCITPVFSNLARCTRYNQQYGLHLQHSIDVSPNSSVSSNNKTDRQDITEILLKPLCYSYFSMFIHDFFRDLDHTRELVDAFLSKQFNSNDRQYHELSNTNNLFEI